MKSFLFLILSLFALTANAQQNYYEFGWNNQYGIVDKDGNETPVAILPMGISFD